MNFTHAAKELNITQPAVSQHIHYLESHYQCKLFSQKGKQLFLTESGALLLSSATTMRRDELILQKQLQFGIPQTASLNFGTTLTVGQFIVPECLATYLKKSPTTKVHMTVNNTKELCSLVDCGTIDFAIVEGNFSKKEYDYLLWKQEKILPVCSGIHEFASQPHTLSELTNETLIVRELHSGGRDILQHSLEQGNLNLSDYHNLMEINNIHAIKKLVAMDCGISFLYESAVKKEMQEGSLRTFLLQDFNVIHDINFIWRKNSCFSDLYINIFHNLKQGL